MPDLILAHEPFIRFGCFGGVLLAMAAWEALAPKRRRLVSRWIRWPSNLGVVALNTLALRLVFPAAAVGIAALAQQRGWGLLNDVEFPEWIEIGVAFVLLDLAIYLQHVMFHAV